MGSVTFPDGRVLSTGLPGDDPALDLDFDFDRLWRDAQIRNGARYVNHSQRPSTTEPAT
jgi:hypothetical protein